MNAVNTQIKINAPVETCWNVLTDFESLPEWNPFITEIVGEPKTGTQIKITIVLNEKQTSHFTPKVLVCEPQKEFRWLGRMFVKGLFDGEHYFQFEAQPDGSTFFTHGERFTGILVGLIMGKIGEDTERGFEKMNQAFKERAESIAS